MTRGEVTLMLQITWLAAVMNAAFGFAQKVAAKVFLAETQSWT
jgi:hypothetical protein